MSSMPISSMILGDKDYKMPTKYLEEFKYLKENHKYTVTQTGQPA